VAVADTASIAEDAVSVGGGLLGNVSDLDGDPLVVSEIDGVVDPALDVVGSYGSLNWAADGSYVYTLDNANPAVQALGVGQSLTDTFTYTLSDGQGGSDTATLTVTIDGTNDGPVVFGPLVFSVDATSPAGTVVGQILAADPDASDVLSFSLVGGGAGGAFAIDATTGVITLVDPNALAGLDNPLVIEVRVADSGTPSLSATVNVTLNLENLLGDVWVPDAEPISETPDPTGVDDVAAEVQGPGRIPTPNETGESAPRVDPVASPVPPGPLPSAGSSSLSFEGAAAGTAPVYDLDAPTHHQSLQARLEVDVESIARDLLKNSLENEQREFILATLATSGALALSAGFLSFLLRAGSLLPVLLASLPVWHRLDVLAVLALSDRERRERKEAIARAEADELSDSSQLRDLFGDDDDETREEETDEEPRSDAS
jgi:VCBS repeat-containing protein